MAALTVIEHDEVGSGGTASWSETGISGSYDHLLIKAQERNSSGGAGRYPQVRLGNSTIDTGSNYSTTYVYARQASVYGGAHNCVSGRESGTYIPLYYGCDDNNADETFSSLEIWIMNYSNTDNFKSVLSKIGGPDVSTSDYNWGFGFQAGLWKSTSAVTEVQILPWNSGGGAKHMEHSTFTLYGVTGA